MSLVPLQGPSWVITTTVSPELRQVSSLRFPSGHSGLVLTLSNAACASLFSPCWLVADVRVGLCLEGKPRTPLSSRVATRVSWSPLATSKQGLNREAWAALLRVRTRPECPEGQDTVSTRQCYLFAASLPPPTVGKMAACCPHPRRDVIPHVSSLRLPSRHSGLVLTLSNAAHSSVFSPRLLVVDTYRKSHYSFQEDHYCFQNPSLGVTELCLPRECLGD